MEVARDLVARGRTRHGLFLAHLALEKVLKAHVCRQTRDLAPKIHSLVRLAELALIELANEHLDTLAEMNAFNVEGRYPERWCRRRLQRKPKAIWDEPRRFSNG